VDGGEVLWDLPGEVALALFAHDNDGLPYSEIEESQGASIRQQIPIRFGLRLYDTDYAFDPGKHANPQLKITFDEATINTAGATGYVSDSWTFSLLVRLMEGAPAPKGFLSARVVEQFTSAASGDKRVEMPVDRTIRYLISRCWEHDTEIYNTITNHKLSENGGKFVPFDLAARDFINLMTQTFKPIERRFTAFISDGDVRETFVAVPLNGYLIEDSDNCYASGNFYIDGTVLVYVSDHAGNSAGDGHVYISNLGWALHGTLIHAFGDRMRPEHWYTPPADGKLDYFLTQGNADADCDICVQQVYRY
jgi:hypothetical protein